MVVEAFSGVDPGLEVAERETGYVEGRGTWQFMALNSLANRGLNVVDHEQLDTALFVESPEEAIRLQVRDDVVAKQIIAETDLAAERANLQDCLRNPRVDFVQGIPRIDDLQRKSAEGQLLICNINQRVLENESGHVGHFVLVEAVEDEVVFHDPAPPGVFARRVPLELFGKAWTSPSLEMANYIAVVRK